LAVKSLSTFRLKSQGRSQNSPSFYFALLSQIGFSNNERAYCPSVVVDDSRRTLTQTVETRRMQMQNLLTKDEAANYLRVSTRTIDRERDNRKLRWVSVGRSVRFRIADLEQYVANSTKETRA